MAGFKVHGASELARAFRKIDATVVKELRPQLREAGELVRAEATSLFSGVDQRSAAGYKVRVRARGVAVEQSLRKTTGQHPDYGSLQMRRALLPALAAKESAVLEHIQSMVDRAADGAGF